ncbi:MAG: hypothetical protein IJ223_03150 [Clostridia bacterium]|nr:hypothetical protein [Clostridia bacterium]
MKKTIVTLLIMVILMMLMVIPSKADSFDVKMTPSVQTVKKGETVKLIVAIENANIGNDGYVSFKGTLEYDKNVFEGITKKKIEPIVEWDSVYQYNEANGMLALVGEQEVKANTDIFSIEFTVSSSAPAGNTTITLKDMEFGSKNTKVEPTNASTTISITDGSTTPTPTPSTSDTTAPTLDVKYADVTGGKQVTITSNEPVQAVSGWTLSADKKTLTKTYSANFNGKISVLDEAGNKAEATVNVELSNGGTVNIVDVTKPTGKVTYAKDSRGVTVTIAASEAVQPISGWTLSADKKVLTRLYSANTRENITLVDLAGNRSEVITVNVDTTTTTGGGASANDGTSRSSGSTTRSDTANSSLPKAGLETYLLPLIAIVAIGGVVTFFKYRDMKY